ncbi:hypothetical protein B0O80DRAFT_484843 [Mortierella sp. GBAus27b]|nr:hypothetical protein BGX31_002112 [Mortierella sp. GBA43]KAI8358749.1 hypothetical protein B0O80DRAFT_484843 [Mortierella sp. GBAus27b]
MSAPPTDFQNDDTVPVSHVTPIIYVAVGMVAFIALVFYGRRCFMGRRRKNQDLEANPPLYDYSTDYHVSDVKSPNGPGTPPAIATPATAMVRGEGYFIVTPRTHSRAGSINSSGSSTRSRSNSDASNKQTTGAPRTQPPAYQDPSSAV